jgi:hypothetical protein
MWRGTGGYLARLRPKSAIHNAVKREKQRALRGIACVALSRRVASLHRSKVFLS